MKPFSHTYEVWSPRWGHTDPYSVTFSEEGISISCPHGPVKCAFPDESDPVWSGYNDHYGRNPLMNVFSNDQIHVSKIVVFALQWAWEKWRSDEVSEEDLRAGMQELFTWIDSTSRSKPRCELWFGAF